MYLRPIDHYRMGEVLRKHNIRYVSVNSELYVYTRKLFGGLKAIDISYTTRDKFVSLLTNPKISHWGDGWEH